MAGDLPSWQSPEAETYKKIHGQMNALFTTAGMCANAMAAFMKLMSKLVQAVYDLIRKEIKKWAKKAAVKVALSGPFAEIALAWALKDIADLVGTLNQIVSNFQAVVNGLKTVASQAKQLFEEAKGYLDALTQELSGSAGKVRAGAPPLPGGGRISETEAYKITQDVDSRAQRQQQAERDRAPLAERKGLRDPADSPGAALLDKGRSDPAAELKTEGEDEKLFGYRYPTVADPKPLMPSPPQGPSAVEEVEDLKSQRKPALR
ncbi:hypothetical protein GCM10027418_30900 [Mariniluteicoccus endophyticus]